MLEYTLMTLDLVIDLYILFLKKTKWSGQAMSILNILLLKVHYKNDKTAYTNGYSIYLLGINKHLAFRILKKPLRLERWLNISVLAL